MNSRTYYYARVSSKEQNLDRQIAVFKSLGADDRDIITDKESGKDLERKGYQALKNAMLQFYQTYKKVLTCYYECAIISENNKGYDEDGQERGISESRWLVRIGINLS